MQEADFLSAFAKKFNRSFPGGNHTIVLLLEYLHTQAFLFSILITDGAAATAAASKS